MSRRHQIVSCSTDPRHVNVICINLLLFNILFAYVQIGRYRETEETFKLHKFNKLQAVIEIDTILFGIQFLTVDF